MFLNCATIWINLLARGRRRSSGFRTVQVFRGARRASRKGGRRGFAKKFGGGLLDLVERGLGKGMLYGGVANKIFPGIAPIATLYGEYAGGGFEGVLINELLVKPFIGLPSQLGSILGPGGLNLSGIFGGGGGMAPGQVPNPMNAMI